MKNNDKEYLNSDYVDPDLYKMIELRLKNKSAKVACIALLISLGSFMVSIIALFR